MIDVRGTCPACANNTLFLGDGGHITCSWIDCPDPAFVDNMLNEHTQQVGDTTGQIVADLEHARKQINKLIAHFSGLEKLDDVPS